MENNIEYKIKSKIWKYKGAAGWHFITLPVKISKSIRKMHGKSEEGWGRLKVVAEIDHQKWETALWFDTKAGSYLLPIKITIRKALGLEVGVTVSLRLTIEVEKVRSSLG